MNWFSVVFQAKCMCKYNFFLDVEIGIKIFCCDLCLFHFGLKVSSQRYLKAEPFLFVFLSVT